MGHQITIQGSYGKRKVIETISFDSDRVYGQSVQGDRIYIMYEDRPIKPANEAELLSFYRQLEGKTPVEVKAAELDKLERVKVTYIEVGTAHELFRESKYMFELPRIGESFKWHSIHWRVLDFIQDWDSGLNDIVIYVSSNRGLN